MRGGVGGWLVSRWEAGDRLLSWGTHRRSRVQMSEQPRIHIDLPAIEGKLGTGIRRVAAFMAIGLNASRTVTASTLVLDHSETMFRFFDEEPAAEVLEEAGREFRMWIQANGLRELCSFLEQYLSDIYLAAAWIKLSDGGKVASGAKVPELPKDFVRKGLGTKLALLERDFGITATHGKILSTFWDARNCLTHRLGFVGEAALIAGDALVVKWIGVESWLLLEGEEPRLLPLDLGEGVHTEKQGSEYLFLDRPSRPPQSCSPLQLLLDLGLELSWTQGPLALHVLADGGHVLIRERL